MVAISPYNQTCDCEPTLTDAQVVDFCRNGYLVLEGVVPDEVNRQVVRYLDEADSGLAPNGIALESWFVEGLLKNAQAAGAVRSLLGANFTLPMLIANHRGALPCGPGGWHRDGGSVHTQKLEYLQVFYYPQDCPLHFGPTEVLPGSHFMRLKASMMMNFGQIAGAVPVTGRAGTIFLTVYSIWHRRRPATTPATTENRFRNLLKYNYWRTGPPRRDWKWQPGFDFNQVDFNPPNRAFEQFQGGIAAARMFCWLAGLEHEYEKRGGQCWPICYPFVPKGAEQMGIPAGLRT
ncbi:MAG: phytanoyl-CoA dioxygenase family protein [Planctomycetes bacterium]|nr:phytanoyl-CoA dioxygenase family protein [Planctomycetota bacterium]